MTLLVKAFLKLKNCYLICKVTDVNIFRGKSWFLRTLLKITFYGNPSYRLWGIITKLRSYENRKITYHFFPADSNSMAFPPSLRR